MEVATRRAEVRNPLETPTRPAAANGAAARAPVGPPPGRRLRKLAAMLGVFHKFSSNTPTPVLRQRQLVADLCRLVGAQLGQPTGTGRPRITEPALVMLDDLGLSARMRQTLQGLLAGEAEKQIAYRLKLSPHTVHVYVKGLYRHFGVSSRGELLARFVRSDAGTN
jgi:DNA-binding CsgD family transcriptional regulator